MIFLNFFNVFSVKAAEEFLKIACSLLDFKEQDRAMVFSSIKKSEAPAEKAKKPTGGFMGFFKKWGDLDVLVFR